jgi:hypothetical protein
MWRAGSKREEVGAGVLGRASRGVSDLRTGAGESAKAWRGEVRVWTAARRASRTGVFFIVKLSRFYGD